MKPKIQGAGAPFLSEAAKESCESFIQQADLQTLSNGLRNLLLVYNRNTGDREVWFGPFLIEFTGLFDFLDELKNEYEED